MSYGWLFLVILVEGGDRNGEKSERELCTIDPKILHFGTPVAVLSSLNEDEVLQVHAASDLILKDNYIDPAKWSPLIYSFRYYFRLAGRALGKTFRAEA